MVQQFNLSHVRQLEISCQKQKVCDLESRLSLEFCSGHPNMHIAQACLENVSPSKFWSFAYLYPDLVSRLHTKSDSWVINKENKESVYRHFTECLPSRDNYSSLWSNLKTKIINFDQTDGITMSDFITNLDLHGKVLLLLGGLSLPFDDASVILIKRFVASAVDKIHKLWTGKLRELEAPWLTK